MGYREKDLTGKQTEQLWGTYCLLATVLDNFTYWEGKDAMGKENAQKMFSGLFFIVLCVVFFDSANVTQATSETFTDDPSKLPLFISWLSSWG